MRIRSIGFWLALLVAAQMCFGQATKRKKESTSEVVLVRVPGSEVTNEDSAQLLSNTFVVAALRSASTLRDWQDHLSTTIRNGYPPSNHWIGLDRNRAADALRLASLVASTDADKEVVEQLTSEFRTMEAWSTECLDGYKNLRLARYYMSPEALENDQQFQQSAQCTQTLLTVLSKGEVTEQPLCR